MPYYDYKCNSCDHEFEKEMKIRDRKVPTEEPCPECSEREVFQSLAKPYHGDPWHFAGKKPDEGFRDRLREIKKHHKHNTINVR